MACVGICGSDIKYWKHGSTGRFRLTAPMVLGEEVGRGGAGWGGAGRGRAGQGRVEWGGFGPWQSRWSGAGRVGQGRAGQGGAGWGGVEWYG